MSGYACLVVEASPMMRQMIVFALSRIKNMAVTEADDGIVFQRDRGHVARIFRAFILDEIAEIRFLALADRRLE